MYRLLGFSCKASAKENKTITHVDTPFVPTVSVSTGFDRYKLSTHLRKHLAVINIMHSKIKHDRVITCRFKCRGAKHHGQAF